MSCWIDARCQFWPPLSLYEDVAELADDPAVRAVRQTEDVGEADVLVDLLALAHLVLLRRRQPHELRMQLVDRERTVLPALAAIVGEDATAPLADGPRGVGVERLHAEEVRVLGDLVVRLPLPGQAAVLGPQHQALLADGPAALRIGHRDVVEQFAGTRLALLPGLAAVVADVDGTPVARRDDGVRLR